MNAPISRRAAITGLGAGAAGAAALSLLAPTTLAAISSGAGVVAGGSLEGPAGPVQFSAFGSRLESDDGSEPLLAGAIAWHDPAGADGAPLTLALVDIASYGPDPVDAERTRVMTGTVSVNGEGEHPFALRLVDNGAIGVNPDSVRLAIGEAAAEVTGTPVAAGADTSFAYDVEGELTAGDIQIISFG
jgi:hypothetical protein